MPLWAQHPPGVQLGKGAPSTPSPPVPHPVETRWALSTDTGDLEKDRGLPEPEFPASSGSQRFMWFREHTLITRPRTKVSSSPTAAWAELLVSNSMHSWGGWTERVGVTPGCPGSVVPQGAWAPGGLLPEPPLCSPLPGWH